MSRRNSFPNTFAALAIAWSLTSCRTVAPQSNADTKDIRPACACESVFSCQNPAKSVSVRADATVFDLQSCQQNLTAQLDKSNYHKCTPTTPLTCNSTGGGTPDAGEPSSGQVDMRPGTQLPVGTILVAIAPQIDSRHPATTNFLFASDKDCTRRNPSTGDCLNGSSVICRFDALWPAATGATVTKVWEKDQGLEQLHLIVQGSGWTSTQKLGCWGNGTTDEDFDNVPTISQLACIFKIKFPGAQATPRCDVTQTAGPTKANAQYKSCTAQCLEAHELCESRPKDYTSYADLTRCGNEQNICSARCSNALHNP